MAHCVDRISSAARLFHDSVCTRTLSFNAIAITFELLVRNRHFFAKTILPRLPLLPGGGVLERISKVQYVCYFAAYLFYLFVSSPSRSLFILFLLLPGRNVAAVIIIITNEHRERERERDDGRTTGNDARLTCLPPSLFSAPPYPLSSGFQPTSLTNIKQRTKERTKTT